MLIKIYLNDKEYLYSDEEGHNCFDGPSSAAILLYIYIFFVITSKKVKL
ncbi:hypothetical protein [Borreliella lusitaniae]|uniref:Uncharacterized protein n=1 Tax=Borreliella lusitaniae TaxID=100177 RepID=A0ACD5GLI2_9SPIR